MNDDLREKAEGYLNSTLTKTELLQLESVLRSDAVSKREFVEHLVLHAHLGMVAEELAGAERPEFLHNTATHRYALQVTPVAVAQRSALRALVASAVAACLLGAVVWFSANGFIAEYAAKSAYDLAPIPIRTVGYVDSDLNQTFPVIAGSNASGGQPTVMHTGNGSTVYVASDSRYGFASETSGLLYRGEVVVSSLASSAVYSIELPNIRVTGNKARFRVQRNSEDLIRVEALAGQVEIQSRVSIPRLYWSFDSVNIHDKLHFEKLPLLPSDYVERVPGLIGSGALGFTQRGGGFVNILGGTEPQVGGGLFSMSGGMSIEAVITSTWDAADDNHDVIFRKEDGPNRILLSLQNNQKSVNDFAMPKVPPGPVLSFGIFLRELGYSELDMPLDGKEGRPNVAQIADGKPHLITASYDSFSGTKAIAIDGQCRFSNQFPIGHCIQSGGPKPAMIGGWRKRETFSGKIDELAIYDYALSKEELEIHYDLFCQGKPWITERTNEQTQWKTINTLSPGDQHEWQISLFPKTSE